MLSTNKIGAKMKLAEWLVNKGMRQAEFARQMEVTQPTVHNWIYGKRPPSGMHMMDIYKMSKGQVGLKDWCEAFDR